MVRFLDYAVRIEQAREAVLAIVARDGVAALNQVTLAAELGLSLATVKRSISSSRVLPRLGVELLARRFRREVARQGWPDVREEFDRAVARQLGALAGGRLDGGAAIEGPAIEGPTGEGPTGEDPAGRGPSAEGPSAESLRDEWVVAVRTLWCAVPGDDSAADDARCWATLTAAFAGHDDVIRELRDEREAWIAGLVEDAVDRFSIPACGRDHEVILLRAVVTGLVEGASRGRVAPEIARAALIRHALTRSSAQVSP